MRCYVLSVLYYKMDTEKDWHEETGGIWALDISENAIIPVLYVVFINSNWI